MINLVTNSSSQIVLLFNPYKDIDFLLNQKLFSKTL